jgi:ketosteroid isomerase-like protein
MKEELEKTLDETESYLYRIDRIEETSMNEIAAARAELKAAENRAREAEAKVREYSRKIAALEREKEKEIAIHVAKEETAEKKAARAKVKRETLKGEPSMEALEKVRKAIEGWRVAWKTKDPDGYISYYADNAEIRKITVIQGKQEVVKMDKWGLREEMKKVFNSREQFTMSEPELEAGAYAVRAVFEFFKQMPAEAYQSEGQIIKHDKWLKELLFREVNKVWKIVKEDWMLYSDIPEYADRW